MNFLIFGDQSAETFGALRALELSSSPVVRDFLTQADIALRRQISLLPRPDREQLPKFSLRPESFGGWGESLTTHPVLRPVLTTTAQIVEFLRYMDAKRDDPDLSTQYILGSCTGLLSAAAATASTSGTSDWVPLGVQIVCIAFRIGLQTSSIANGLARNDGPPKSWSSIVQGKVAPEVLAEFHKNLHIPVLYQAYVSAITPNSTTISGPPHTLRKLFDSATFRATGCSASPIPVHAPYHAGHLHQAADIAWIVGTDERSIPKILGRYRCVSVLLSTKTGKPFTPKDMTSLLRQVVSEILNDVLRWDTVLAEVDSLVPSQSEVTATVIGSPALGKTLVSTLNASERCKAFLKAPSVKYGNHSIENHNHMVSQRSKIAIVGMSGRFPGAKDTEDLWRVLSQGLDVHKEVPQDRFDVTTHVDPTGKTKNTSVTPYGCFIDQPGLFDPSFFHISPREAAATDPMQRLMLVSAYEALEMSGYVPNRTPSSMLDRVGTFYGQTLDDYREVNVAQKIDAFYVTGGLRPFGPGRINYYYKFTGPSFSVDTACSSSLAALHIACNSLWNGDCDTAVTGGTNIITGSDMYAGLSRGQFLSKTGSCKTFDNTADGYCRADAVGTVILKRLEDAEADNDPILGVILGSTTNHSSHASSITQPHGSTQEILYKTILNQAGIKPLDVDYVEMHGTGTQVGDSTEMESVSNVFASVNARKPDHPLYVGSVKPNLGHSEAAAGVTAVIKVLLMFQKNMIPPHIGIKGEINHKFPSLDERHVRIPFHNESFRRRGSRKRRILINNFGAAGGNTSLLMEEPPLKPPIKPFSARSVHAITVSAKNPTSLKLNKQRMFSFLEKQHETSLADLSYTTTCRRPHYRHRFVTVASTIHDIQESLVEPDESTWEEKPQLVFVFTGQGGIYTGVGKELFDISRQFRSYILQFDHMAQIQGFLSFVPLLDATVDVTSLSAVQIQLGQVCVQMALYRLYKSWGVDPGAVIGHSLGEYAALYACEVLTANDTIALTGRRAELMERSCTPGTHAMLAVKAPSLTVKDLVSSTQAEIACINGPNDVVLSGLAEDIQSAARLLADHGLRCIQLPVPFACHSAQLDPIVELFENVAKSVEFHQPRIPLLSPLVGRDISHGGIIDAKYLSRHLREKVDFFAAIENSNFISTEQRVQFVEVGPHPLCSGMIRNILGNDTIQSMRKGENSWKVAAQSLAALYMRGMNIDWEGYHRDLASSSCLVTLPSYAFDEKNYWIEYKNDWALSKGDDIFQSPVVEKKQKGPSTSSIQRLISESLQEHSAKMEFESDLTHPALYDAITGHVINGIGLCPSSVFADMAFTAAKFLHENTTPEFDDLCMNITDMEILAPVILELSGGRKPQHLRILATLTQGQVHLQFLDKEVSDPTATLYAKCTVVLYDAAKSLRHWSRSTHFISSRIEHLETKKGVNKLHRRMAYKLFGMVVEYAERYHGMDHVLVDSEHYEATAQVSFKTHETMGNFFRSPYWIDSLTQLAGFVMNANETVDTSKTVYISNGWESLQNASQLSSHKTYTIYVRMQPDQGTIFSGDLYILDECEVISVATGIKFQAVPRQLLKLLLAPPSKGPRTRSVPKPDDTHGRTNGLSSTHNGSSAHTEPASSSLSSGKFTPISSANTNWSRKQFPDGLDSSSSINGLKLSSLVLNVLGEELGIEIQELGGKVNFANIGVDSLMSLTIIGRLRESFGVEFLPTIFEKYPTVDGLVKFLESEYEGGFHGEGSEPPATTRDTIGPRSSHGRGSDFEAPILAKTHHRATSVMLQGNIRAITNNLFLFPGGFGTSSSFAPMPHIDKNLAVFGLNSAFVNAPEDFNVSIPEMATLYLTEIRRRQTHGPYSFLGYSVGGIIAYEAARQLIVAGEVVERLYLVDSPCPLVIPPMPPKLIEFLDSIDRFNGTKQTAGESEEVVKPMGSLHVTQTLISLESYVPKPLPDMALSPRTTYYVARHGVASQSTVKWPEVSERDLIVMTWLLDDRPGLGGSGDGWEMLVDRAKLKIIPIAGNHFNIMKEPNIIEWAGELKSSFWGLQA